jgi:hypothetical protein
MVAPLTASKIRLDEEASAPTMTFEEDVLVLRVIGEVSAQEMRQLIDMGEQLYARYGYILVLGDGRRATGLHPDARKLQSEQLKRFVRPSHTAMYHINAIVRVMSTLVQRGIEILTGRTYAVSFHKDEAEARAELARQRVLLQRGAGRPPGGA